MPSAPLHVRRGGLAAHKLGSVLFPFVTVFVYLVTRGRGMAERSAEVQQRAEQQFRA